jgi:anti-sigma factor RsiW
MDREQLEFRICQYLDGTLPAGDRAALEQTLAADADAQAMLAQHRRLQQQLNRHLATPELNWDRLAEHLSASVAEAAAADVRGSQPISLPVRFGWRQPWGWLSAAASVLLAATVTLLVARHARHAVAPLPLEMANRPSSIVIVPQPEPPAGSPVEQITIGPSPALAAQGGDWRYAQGVVAAPSRAVVVSRADAGRDNHAPLPPAH